MDLNQFINVFAEAEKVWKFSDLEKKRIFHHCKQATPNELYKTVVWFVDQGIKPKVNDFRAKLTPSFQNTSDQSKEYVIKCHKCADSGVLEVSGPGVPSRMFMLCDCPEGEFQPWVLPRFDKQLWGHLTTHSMVENASDWKPAEFNGEDDLKPEGGSFWQKVQEWKERVWISEKFWHAHIRELVNG